MNAPPKILWKCAEHLLDNVHPSRFNNSPPSKASSRWEFLGASWRPLDTRQRLAIFSHALSRQAKRVKTVSASASNINDFWWMWPRQQQGCRPIDFSTVRSQRIASRREKTEEESRRRREEEATKVTHESQDDRRFSERHEGGNSTRLGLVNHSHPNSSTSFLDSKLYETERGSIQHSCDFSYKQSSNECFNFYEFCSKIYSIYDKEAC